MPCRYSCHKQFVKIAFKTKMKYVRNKIMSYSMSVIATKQTVMQNSFFMIVEAGNNWLFTDMRTQWRGNTFNTGCFYMESTSHRWILW